MRDTKLDTGLKLCLQKLEKFSCSVFLYSKSTNSTFVVVGIVVNFVINLIYFCNIFVSLAEFRKCVRHNPQGVPDISQLLSGAWSYGLVVQ